jgi:hypothetical protein
MADVIEKIAEPIFKEPDTKLRADEKLVEIHGDLRIAILADNARRIIHPSGVECIETFKQIEESVACAQEKVSEAMAQLADAQAMAAEIISINTASIEAETKT